LQNTNKILQNKLSEIDINFKNKNSEMTVDFQSEFNKIPDFGFRKSRSSSLSHGIRSTLKVLQTLEDERVKAKCENYEFEIEKLNSENKRLKEAINKKSENSEFIDQVIKRAQKLNNYIEEKFKKPKTNSEKTWEIIDIFTRNARAYIRNSEKTEQNVNKLKCAKGRFMEYIEKEVTELSKSWNLMEEERSKLKNIMQKLSIREENEFGNFAKKKEKIEDEIAKLEQKKLEIFESIEQLVIKEQEVKNEIEKYSNEIGKKSEKVKELDESIFEHEYILEEHKKKISECKNRLGILKSELSILEKNVEYC